MPITPTRGSSATLSLREVFNVGRGGGGLSDVIWSPVTLTCVCECVNAGKQAAGSDNAVTYTHARSAGGPASLRFWQKLKTHFQV